ncbi:MAG: hypothetical protein ACXIVF_06920 [Rhizobiaceae bacterium]
MIWNLGFGWLTLMIGCVTILAFILAMALDALMGRESFGPVGNAFVLTGSFFLSIYLFNIFGYNLSDMKWGAGAGVLGAFVGISSLAVVKGLLNRW